MPSLAQRVSDPAPAEETLDSDDEVYPGRSTGRLVRPVISNHGDRRRAGIMDISKKTRGPNSGRNMPRAVPRKENSEFEDAVALAYITYTAQRQDIKVPTAVKEKFGQLFAFTQEEVNQLSAVRDLIVRYVGQRSPARPLCIAVFGPPGSGKSFSVKQIRNMVAEKVKDTKLKIPLTLVNLTQVSDSIDLGRVIARIAGEQDEDTVPIVFFDEFDAPRNNAPYGWLQWFLAPMHDGEFLHEGAVIRLKRAVYVFAGGTADTMSEFSGTRLGPIFRAAKGPDFISRLRGYLDVQGPNAEPRALRRAVLLRNELQDRTTRGGHKAIKLDESLLKALLEVGRYRHGARSIAAIIELSDLRNDNFGWNELPEDHLIGLHIDRGPLDSKLIGGSIAFSGYATSVEVDDALASCWLSVARELWREGATLSYAGSWGEGAGGELMKLLARVVQDLPVEPSRTQARRDKPSPWFVSFLKDNTSEAKQSTINDTINPDERARCGLHLVTAEYLTDQERTELAQAPWSLRLVERFRRRLAVSESSVARFAIAGATEKHEGRVPGIAEELMLTLALQKPVYVAGGFGGAAMVVGSLLGLARFRTGEVPEPLKAQPKESELAAIREKLQPGPWTSLPITAAEIASFLKERAIGGPYWPDNGLSVEENRRLFESTEEAEVAKLVAQGLRHRFDARIAG